MNPNMMQLLGRINPQVMQQPIINPVQARLRRPQIDQTTIAEAPQPTIYSTPVAEQESQVYSTPQAETDPLRGRLITPPHDFEGDAQAEKDAIARAGAEREAINQENARPMPMYIGPNAKGYDDLDPNLHPEFSSLADRMRRKEISDAGATFTPKKLSDMVVEGQPLKDVYNHPELMGMYPKRYDSMRIIADPYIKSNAAFDSADNSIRINPLYINKPDIAKELIGHELQHGVQEDEGFATGGSSGVEAWLSSNPLDREQLIKATESIFNEPPASYETFWGKEVTPEGKSEYNKYLKDYNSISGKKKRLLASQQGAPSKVYKNLAGEVEARDTQARMDLSMADRLKKEPLSSQGVRPQDMIVRRLKGGVSNSVGESKPITAYHKTNADFEEFDPSKVGENDYGYAGQGVYLTPKPLGGLTYGKNTLKTEVNLKNPYVRTSENWKSDPLNPYTWIAKKSESDGIPLKDASKMWTDMMKEKGYDGFIDKTSPNGEIVVFDTKQVKIISNNKENK